MDGTTVYVLLVIFVATLIRSVFGFGEALVAVPLLALRLPVDVAAPLAVLVSITVAAVIVAQDWEKIHLHSTGWLVLSTLAGIPLGLLLLTAGNQHLVKGSLAVIIMAFSAYSLLGRRPPQLHSDSRALASWLWLLRRRAGRGLRDERTTSGDLWRDAPLVRATFSRNLTGIFPARQPHRHGRLFCGRAMGPAGHPLLLIVAAAHHSRHLPGPRGESSSARPGLSEVCACRPAADRGSFAGPSCSLVVHKYAVLRYFPRQAILPLCLRPCRQRPRSFPNTK